MINENLPVSIFDYDLPEHFIAQNPVIPRHDSKLLVYDTKNDRILHKRFFEIGEFLTSNDLLITNRSKVLPVRLILERNGRECEIFLLKELKANVWQAMIRPGKMFPIGAEFIFPDFSKVTVINIFPDATREVTFSLSNGQTVHDLLMKYGAAPLPPYIKNSTARFDQYQTVYAKEEGSVAAPTAGLHFTNELIEKLKNSGVSFLELLLHVSRGTFLPVKSENVSDHVMHKEYFEISNQDADTLNEATASGKRVVAVGTTSVRILESALLQAKNFSEISAETDIFIYPGHHKWKMVDSLITNFHLPKSTLIMLVASFLESKGVTDPIRKIKDLYEEAKKENYRFFSFGDAMFLF